MKPLTLSPPIYRMISNHSWTLALIASIAVHGVLVIGICLVWPSASSKGEGQVMLLESITDETHVQSNTQARKASKLSVQSEIPTKATKLSGSRPQATPQSNLNKPQQTEQLQAIANSSNQGTLIDQSGKAQTPQDAYQQAILKHLLNRMGSAPVTGKAEVQLSIMSAGIAIEVQIKRIKGPVAYEQWLKSKVLNANPFPAIPKELGVSQFKTTIPIEHTNEP